MTETRFDLARLLRPNIARMKPYSSARDEFKGEAEVFLDANENPFPTGYNRYPDPLQWEIKKRLSTIKPVAPEQIFLGNGSDEAIDLLIRAFCEPNTHSILITEPTYGMYAVCADVNAVAIRSVSLTVAFDIDLPETLAAIDASTRIIFLCSPNNPSGNLLSRDKIESLLRNFNGIIVVDEAYIDFADSESWLSQLSQYPNLVVMQTFSKAWGLAALRCGMAYASPEIISILNKIKYPYNINAETQKLVLDALNREDKKNNWVNEILEQRNTLTHQLSMLGIVEHVYPSDANFVLVRTSDASAIYKYLMDSKIIVRDRSKVKLCANCLRITVGTEEENTALITALKSFKTT